MCVCVLPAASKSGQGVGGSTLGALPAQGSRHCCLEIIYSVEFHVLFYICTCNSLIIKLTIDQIHACFVRMYRKSYSYTPSSNFSYTVEPPLKETPNKGQDSEHQNVTFL